MARRKIYNPEPQLYPFIDVNETEFEDLCRDLFAKSNEVTHARKLFGKGYKQFGGDILIQAAGSDASFVAQCKHYPISDYSRADIEKAVNLFADHWESHWEKHKVTRFYLLVARPITTDDQLLTVQEQRARLLKDFNVEFVYWDSTDLERELKPHRDLVREYLGEYWEKICPPNSAQAGAAGFVGDPIAARLLNREFEQMASLLSESTRQNLEPVRELARVGRQAEAFAQLTAIKIKSFDRLDRKTRAELLSLEIRLGFPRLMDAPAARRILDEIEVEDPEFQTLYIDALVTSYEQGYAAALDKLAFCPDVSTLNLKLTLLLNADDFAAAAREYEGEAARLAYDAETRRLYAAALLGLDKGAEAEKLIDEVYAEKSHWEGVKIIRAIIYYLSGLVLPPGAVGKNPLAFPLPQPWHLIKTDDDSQRKRRAAAEAFQELLEIKDRNSEQRRILETWLLAALADDQTRQSDALDYCRQLLADDPAHSYALIWAINRNFQIDFARSTAFLAAQFAGGGELPEEQLNEALVLLPLYLQSEEFDKAASHLAKIKPFLVARGNERLADYWHCQIEIARTGGATLDPRVLNLLDDAELRRSLQINQLGTRFQKKPSRANRRMLLRRLLKLYRRSGDGLALYNYCLLSHEQKNWREIAFYADALLARIPTPDAVRLAANAFYRTKLPEKTLSALNDFRHVFPRGELPDDLSRLKSYALLLSGHPAQAAREAQGLFEREKSAENLLALVETARHTDDLFSISRAIEQMPQLDDLTPKQRLKISHLLSTFNPERAAEMWRAAKERLAEAADLAGDVYIQGQKLGLGQEAEAVFPQMFANAERGTGASWTWTTDEFIEWVKSRSAELEELEKLYQTGQFPVHIYCERRNVALAELFRAQPRRNLETENVTERAKIMTRSAARPNRLEEVFTRQAEWRFHLDLTSLLLCQELDLLDALEKCAPVFVSHEIIPLVNSEIETLQNSPPEVVAPVQTVLRGLEMNLCRRFTVARDLSSEEIERHAEFLKDFNEDDLRLLLQAAEEESAVVVALPLRKNRTGEVVKVTDDFAALTYDWHDVLAALLSTDQLSAAQKSAAETELKKKSGENHYRPLAPETTLYLTGRAATELAKLDLFEPICLVFPAAMDDRNESMLREDIRRFEAEQETIRRLENLKERLRRGFESDIYRGISLERLRDLEPDNKKLTGDYRERALTEILRLKPPDLENMDAVVIEDRFISRHASVENTIPLFTVYELLEYLKQLHILTEDEYYERLMRLRERNFRYLPATNEEILYHFRRAMPAEATIDARFARSRELAALHRYSSDCLLDQHLLQPPAPGGGADNMGDWRFVILSERAVTEAIGRVWCEADSLDAARTQAELLLFDFYVGSFNLRHFFEDFPSLEAGAFHLASDFVSLSFQGISLLTAENLTADERIERATAFFDWVNRIFDAKFRRNSRVVEFAANLLGNAFTHILATLPVAESESDLERAQRAALIIIYSQYINFLPDALSNRLFEIEALWQDELLPKPKAVVTVGRMKFAGDELWQAVAAAMADQVATIHFYDNAERTLDVTREADEENRKTVAVRLTDENGKFFRLTGSFVGLHLPEKEEREAFLSALREAFDCPDDEMRAAIEDIAAATEPETRAARYNELARSSMQLAYQDLAAEVENQKSFSWGKITEMPIESLPKHFRLADAGEDADGIAVAVELKKAAARLLAEEGLETALDRLARFPFSLPENLVDELLRLESAARQALLEKLRAHWHSPVHKLHYLHLALRVLPDSEETLFAARQTAGELFKKEENGEENLEFEVFRTLLSLVAEEFSRATVIKEWKIERWLALAWAHAAEIYNWVAPLAANGDEWKKLLEYFVSMRPFWGAEILSFEPNYWRDCLNPRFLAREFFAAFGAGKSFASFPLATLEKIDLPALLAELCFVEMEGDNVPHPALWKNFSMRTNAPSSFLNAENLELFYALVDTKKVKFFEPQAIPKYLDAVLDKLAANPVEIEAWLELALVTDGRPLTGAKEAKFIQIIEQMDFVAMWQTDEEKAWFVLSTAAAQSAHLAPELRRKIEGWLDLAVERLAEKYPSRHNRRMTMRDEQTWHALRSVDVAAWLSVEPHDARASSGNWNRLLERLGRKWFNLHVWLEPFLFRCWIELPVEQMQGLGRNLLLAKVLR